MNICIYVFKWLTEGTQAKNKKTKNHTEKENSMNSHMKTYNRIVCQMI